MTAVWMLQHHPCETPGIIGDVLAAEGVNTRSIRSFDGEPVPKRLEGASGLIVMGGPMGVDERARYPFLLEEMRLMEHALRNDLPILGICLGSQLLATTLGAQVTRGKQEEIGWHPVTLKPFAQEDRLWEDVQPTFMGFHWHGDIFDLPRGAVELASSALTSHQAFRYGANAYGWLFHMEVTHQIVRTMVATFADELREAQVDGTTIIGQADEYLQGLQRIGSVVFQRWVSLLGKECGASTREQEKPATITAYYEQDHARLDGLLRRFREAKRSDVVTAAQTYRQLMAGLKRHIVWEEEILFPLFEAKTGMSGMGPTAVMRMEHRKIRGLLDAICRNIERHDIADDAEEVALTELLEAHNRKEEGILYPLVDQHLSDEERRGVFARMEQVSGGSSTPCCASC